MEVPDDVKQLESHLTWIPRILSDLKLEDPIAKFDYVVRQLNNCKKSREKVHFNLDQQGQILGEDEEESECHEQTPMWASYLSTKLNIASKSVFVGDYDFAIEQLEEIRRVLLSQLRGVHKDMLFAVGEYFVKALEWSMSKMQQQSFSTLSAGHNNTGEGNGTDSKDTGDLRLVGLQRTWESFQGNRKIMAVVLFWKDLLEKDLQQTSGVELEKHIKKLEEVIELDPNYHMWYHYVLQMKRNVRRFEVENGRKWAPKAEEMKWCDRQLVLAPEVLITCYNFGILLKDNLKMLELNEDQDEEETFEQSLFYLNKALHLSKQNRLEYWTMKIKIERAELIACWGDGHDLSELLELCQVENYQENALLHQILAEIYHYGIKSASGDCLHQDFQKAEVHYKWALAAKQRLNYFECLKGLMKLLPHLPPPSLPELTFELPSYVRLLSVLPTIESIGIFQRLTESLAIIDSFGGCDSTSKSLEIEKALVGVWRACLVWMYNPERDANHKRKACLEWIKISKKYSHRAEVVKAIMQNIWAPPFSGNQGTFFAIEKKQVKLVLWKMKEEMDTDMTTLVDICAFSKKVEAEIAQEKSVTTASSVATGRRRSKSSDADVSFSIDPDGSKLTRWRRSWNGGEEQGYYPQSRPRTSRGKEEIKLDKKDNK